MPEVRCIDCGYLALRRFTNRKLMETEAEIRETGEIPPDQNARNVGLPMYDPFVICFRRAFQLHEEMNKHSGVRLNEKLTRVINATRQCDRFRQWEQGFTPKAHHQMELEERAQVRQEAREKSDWRWRITELIVMGVIVTLVSVAAQIGAAFIERGTLFPDGVPDLTSQLVE